MPEVTLNISTNGGERQIDVLSTSMENLATKVNKTDIDLTEMTESVSELAEKFGVSGEALTAFLEKLSGFAGGIANIRQLKEVVNELAESLEGKEVRSLNAVITAYENATVAVNGFVAANERAIAGGGNLNLGRIESQRGQIYLDQPISTVQSGRLESSIAGVRSTAGAQNEAREYEAQFAAMVQREKEANQSVWRDVQSDIRARADLETRMARETAASRLSAEREVWEQIQGDLRERTRLENDSARVQREASAERLRAEEQIIALEERAAQIGMSAGDRIRRQGSGFAGNLYLSPEMQARGTAANSALANAADEAESSGGSNFTALRGGVQGLMGLGLGDYRMYYLMNSALNLNKGIGDKRWNPGGLFTPSAANPEVTNPAFSGIAGTAAAGVTTGEFGIPVAGIAAGSVVLLALAAAETAAASAASQHHRELRNLAEEMGTTAQNARQLENAAKVSGVDISTINSGMRQLTQGIEESGGRGRGVNAVLAANGIDPMTATGGLKDTKDLLIEISGVIRGMGDIEGRDLLERLFGRGGRQALPLMKQDLGELLKSLDGFNSSLDNTKLDKYAETMSKMGLAWEGLVAKAAEPIVFLVDMAMSPKGQLVMDMVGKMLGAPGELASRGFNAVFPSDATGIMTSKMKPGQMEDFMAGKQIREQALLDTRNTKEGLQGIIAADREARTAAFNALNSPQNLGGSGSLQLRDKYNIAGAALTADEAEFKAKYGAEKKDTTTAALQKALDRAQEGEKFGHAKIAQETQDRLDELIDSGKYTSDRADLITQRGTAEGITYDQQQARALRAMGLTSERSIAGANLSAGRQISASQLSVYRTQNGLTGGSMEALNLEHGLRMGDISEQYQQSMLDVGLMQKSRDLEPNRDKRDLMQGAIDSAQHKAEVTAYSETIRENNRLINERITLTNTMAVADIAAAEATAKTDIALRTATSRAASGMTETMGGIGERYIAGTQNHQLAMIRAGSGVGGSLSLPATQERFRVLSAQRGIQSLGGTTTSRLDEENSLYGANMGVLNTTHASNMAISGLNAVQVAAEQTKYDTEVKTLQAQHINAISELQRSSASEYGKLLEEIDNAHYERQQQSVELLKQQNEEVQNFAGGLISAYTQAEFHRQSGSFPVREALGKDILGWGQKVGTNIVGEGFGALQKFGIGSQNLPWTTTSTADSGGGIAGSDNSDLPYQGHMSPHTQHTTLFGKALAGTPLGPHPQGVQPLVANLDKNLTDINVWLHQHFPLTVAPSEDPSTPAGAASTGIGNSAASIYNGMGGVGTNVFTRMGIPPTISGSGGGAVDIGSILGMGSGMGGLLGGINPPGTVSTVSSAAGMLGKGIGGLDITDTGSIPNFPVSSIPAGTSNPNYTDDSDNADINSMTVYGGANAAQAMKTTMPSAVMSDAATAINDVSAVAKGVKDAITPSNGKSGAGDILKRTSNVMMDAATVANSIPGGQIVGAGLEIGAAVAAGISAILGDPRTDRIKQLNADRTSNTWTAPSAYNLVTTQTGQSATYDITGAPRGYNGPLLAYPNSTSYTAGYDYTFNRNYGAPLPGGVNPVSSTILSVQINALDSKSIMDNSNVLTDAVHAAVNNGHPIRQAINQISNPR